MAQWPATLSTIRKEISYKYSLLFFGYNCFTKAKVLANPHGSIPNSHEREAEEKAESAADLGDHCRLLVKKFLSLHRGVPCLSEKREDEVVWRIWELERGGDGPPLELVLQVVARLSTAGYTPDHLQLFILQLKVDPLKMTAKEPEFFFSIRPKKAMSHLCCWIFVQMGMDWSDQVSQLGLQPTWRARLSFTQTEKL